MTAQPLSTGRPRPSADRAARLRALPPARTATPKAPFVVLVLGLLGAGLVGLLLLNTALAQGAFTLRDLQRGGVTLGEREQALQQRIADEQQPGALARRARALGMVAGGAPAFVRLPDGRILGTPRHAGATTPSASAAPTLPPLPPNASRSGSAATAGHAATKHQRRVATHRASGVSKHSGKHPKKHPARHPRTRSGQSPASAKGTP